MPPSPEALKQARAVQDAAAVEKRAKELQTQQSRDPVAWQELGVAQLRQNQPAEAVKSLEQAIALGGNGENLHFDLASALEQTGSYAEAVAHLRQAAAVNPNSAYVQINLAAMLEKIDCPEEALTCGQRAITLNPHSAIAHYNFGRVLQSIGRLNEAIASYSRAVELDPQFALAHTNRGCCRLLQKHGPAGWADYDWRLRTGQIQIAPYPQPRWSGQPLPEGVLLVHGEQGIGDEIQFASCLPEVVMRVGKCVFVCHPRLATLMARSFPAIAVVGQQWQPGSPVPQLSAQIDFQIPSGSLPLCLGITPENCGRRKRFLLADPQKKQQWRKRYEGLGPGLKVGISWRGGGTWEERRRRTTTLNEWRALLSLPGAHFINLQYGDCRAELETIRSLSGSSNAVPDARTIAIHHFDEADPLGNFDDFAAKVAALDLVISIGNATVHLAGALGLPTWCLLPQVPQWRWGIRGETSAWYPSVRLLRQTQHGNWDSALAEATRQLQELIQQKSIQHGGVIPSTAAIQSSAATERLAPRPQPAVPQPSIKPSPAARPKLVALRTERSAKELAVNQWLPEATQRFNENRFEEATQFAEKVLAVDADNIVALRICGVGARKVQNLERSQELLSRAIELSPDHSVLQFELGITYLEQKRHREAYECYLKSIELAPSFQPACVNLSAILEQQERYEEAMVWARRSVALKPDCPLAHYNLANQLRECGRVAEAVKHYETAVQLKPTYTKAKWNLAICYVLLERFADAWPLHEIRDEAEEVKLDKFTQPRWDGSSLAGKSIVVHAEQGIGDEVLFASCFPDVIARAAKTVLICEPRLVKLFARSFPQATVYGWARRKDWSPMPLAEPVDFQIPAGSLPLHLRTTAESFPQRESFLTADPTTVEQWRRRFAELGPGLKVGISWRAGGKANEGRKRTISLTDWRAILQTPGVRFINLQYGDVSDDVAQVASELGVRIYDWEQGDPLVDMDGHAAKIAALDLVISVGNATVHLAGALGTPAWTLLPRVPSWRWMIDGDVSPWYSSVRLFRQPRRLEWEPVLQQISARLGEVAALAAQGKSAAAMTQAIRAVRPQNQPPEECSIEPPSKPTGTWIDADQLNCRQPLQVIAALQEQVEQSQQNRNFVEAERLCREILQITPRWLPAHVRLGLIARETGRIDLAIRCLLRAISIVEPNAVNQAHLAAVYADAGRGAEALRHARRALELDAKLPQAQREFGRALLLVGKNTAAVETLRKTLPMLPDDAAAISALGQALIATGQLDEATDLLREAIAREPAEPLLHLALGRALLEDQCLDDAQQCFRTAAELQPTLGEAQYELSRLLAERGEIEPALAAARKAAEISPHYLPGILHLASLLRRQNAFQEAEALYRQALQRQPEDAMLHHLLGATLAEQGRLEESLTQLDTAVQLNPENVGIRTERALVLLRMEQFDKGWDEYQWRLRGNQPARFGRQFTQQQWDGLPLAERTILVYGEQQLSDEILFASCYPDLIRQAKRCTLVCDARLERLFRRSFPQVEVLGIAPGNEQAWQLPRNLSVDLQCPAGTLPRFIRRSAEAFAQPQPLLAADSNKVAQWSGRLAALGAGLKIGIAWQTDDFSTNSAGRKIKLAQWQPLLSAPGVQWINLHSGPGRNELAEFTKQHRIAIHNDSTADFRYDLDNLAALLATLDLVITVDNTTAHLAGALGIPTWVMLPEPAAWSWFAQRSDSLWYSSVRLFRSGNLQPSGEIFQKMRAELLKRNLRLDEESRIGAPAAPHWSGVHARGKR